MDESKKLKSLIASLQRSVSSGHMTKEAVASSIRELAGLGYEYDHAAFPKLVDTEHFVDTSRDSPSNLAEALLWKLGKWKSYKKFAKHYTDETSKPTDTDVVFYAFAKHLKNKDNPIYDQHAIRAIWAICDVLTAEEKAKCKSLLMNKKGEWKDAGSGGSAVECYKIFLKHLGELVKGGATKAEIDLLLMPLGQAIKKSTNNFEEFCSLSGWEEFLIG
jgi:hypothetical protein